jgi:hypothetical protein
MTRLRKIIEPPDAREKLLRTESGIEYRLVQPSEKRLVGGEGGIRTPGTLIRGTHDFQSCTFNRSVTSPLRNCKYLHAPPLFLDSPMSPQEFTGDRSANLPELALRGKDELHIR